MHKHIKLRGELIPEEGIKVGSRSMVKAQVEVTILEQTHTSKTFGHAKDSTWDWNHGTFAHGPIRMFSERRSGVVGMYPTLAEAATSKVKYWIVMLDDSSSKGNKFKVPLGVWELLKSAVKAHNEFFKE